MNSQAGHVERIRDCTNIRQHSTPGLVILAAEIMKREIKPFPGYAMLDRLVKVFVHRVGERLFLIMKTTTTKTNITKNTALEIRTFTVPVEWVEATVNLDAELAEYINSQSEASRRYSIGSISGFVTRINICSLYGKRTAAETVEAFSRQPENHDAFLPSLTHDIQGRKMQPFTCCMELRDWQRVEKAASFLETTPAAIVRGALILRGSQIKRFHRSQSAA